MLSATLLAETLALVGGTVHTLAGEAPASIATVLIEDGRIAAVGADLSVPEGARVVDAGGLHVIPGLIDGFAYHDAEHEDLYVGAGVTLVRDHGNDLARIFRARAPEAREAALGPALSIAGAVLDGYPPTSSAALVLKSEHEAHAYVPTLMDEAVDFLAVQVNLPESAWREVLDLAHAADGPGLQVWGPCPSALDLEQVVAGGQDGLLFLDALLPAETSWEDVTPEDLAPVVERLAAAGTRITPVLGGTARVARVQAQDDPRLELLGAQYAGIWSNEAALRREGLSEEYTARARAVLDKQRALLASLDAAGVPLVPGSGAPHPWLMPGDGLVAELAEWQAAGLPAARCLELATAGAARVLGIEGRGTIAVGGVADLVCLRADPRADVEALRAIEGVVLRGRWLAREDLDLRRAELAATLRAAREEAARPIAVAEPSLPQGEVILSGYAETASEAGRIAGERWAIVRGRTGKLTFCGRRVVPGGARTEPVEIEVHQTPKGNRLEAFDVTLRTGGRELVVRGQVVADQMRVERRLDGVFIDNKAAREPIAAIDASSVTTLMLLAHGRGEGPLPVIRFDEGLELEVVRWDLALQENGDQWLRTHDGRWFASFREDGALRASVEWSGAAQTTIESRAIDAHGGAGLPLPEERLRRMRAAEAAAPVVGDPEPPGPPDDEGEGGGDR